MKPDCRPLYAISDGLEGNNYYHYYNAIAMHPELYATSKYLLV
jgi:hypothetical protein